MIEIPSPASDDELADQTVTKLVADPHDVGETPQGSPLRASKERAEDALRYLRQAKLHKDESARVNAFNWLENFIQVVAAKLPTEKAYDDEAARRKLQSKRGGKKRKNKRKAKWAPSKKFG